MHCKQSVKGKRGMKKEDRMWEHMLSTCTLKWSKWYLLFILFGVRSLWVSII